jgi:hypothetical protein
VGHQELGAIRGELVEVRRDGGAAEVHEPDLAVDRHDGLGVDL